MIFRCVNCNGKAGECVCEVGSDQARALHDIQAHEYKCSDCGTFTEQDDIHPCDGEHCLDGSAMGHRRCYKRVEHAGTFPMMPVFCECSKCGQC